MSSIVEIRNVKVGEGMPKICVPILERTEEDICRAAKELCMRPFDLVEWRADFYEDLKNRQAVQSVLQKLRKVLGNVPILFTVRTRAEGGNIRLTAEEYLTINMQAAATGLMDLLDVEIFQGDDISFMLIEAAHQAGVKVIASNHDFEKTPKKEELLARLCKMQELEADLVKLAVMPKTERDVLVLLDATLTMKELHKSTPVVTMAMGKMGVVSRLAGGILGSAITFGSAGRESAPGQLLTEELQKMLKILQQ